MVGRFVSSSIMKANPVLNKVVLITGCSTGIGRAAARKLRDDGWLVFPTARKPEDLEALRDEGFNPIALDMAEAASVEKGAAEVLERSGGVLGALVNNAGYGQPGAVEDLTREALRQQFEVNVFGLQQLTNRLLPTFLNQRFGRIVNISSVLGRISVPMLGAYCASKFAVEALSDALRVELRGTGVTVSLVEPGPITTAFNDSTRTLAQKQMANISSRFATYYQRLIAGQRHPRPEHRFRLPPEAVAEKISHALNSSRPKRRYRVTVVSYLGEFMRRFLPHAWVDAIVAGRMR